MRFLNYLLLALIGVAVCIYVAPFVASEPVRVVAPGAPPAELSKEEKQRKAADEFFQGPIVSLAIEMAPEEFERLKRDQRNYVEASVREGDKIYKGVAIKLKGAAGSFQGIDGKPGMTLNFDKFKGAERFHGMKKFHLNNCAQDGSYLNEKIAGEIARAAGVPASRCTHAFVTLNGRDLGLYVVKEGFTRDFLSYFYSDASGDLYDGAFVKEINEDMEKDLGDPKDKRDIKELIAACNEPDATKRWERLGAILDIDRFASFMAIEDLLCHWDGYNFNRNNYRVYKEPRTGKLSFFVHGMDQMFGDPNFPVMRDFGTLVGGAVWREPQGRKLYREKVESIYNNVLKPIDWPARAVEAGNKVRDAIAGKNKQWANDYQGQINSARDRVANRIASVGKQLGDMPKPIEFDKNGILKLTKGWRTEGSAAELNETQTDDRKCLHIRADGETVGSWRYGIALEPGRYRFEANVRTAGVAPTQSSSGEGAGLRISGGTRNGQNAAKGDTPWQKVAFEFDAPGGDVVLVAELRASKGDVWFQSDSLQVVRVK